MEIVTKTTKNPLSDLSLAKSVGYSDVFKNGLPKLDAVNSNSLWNIFEQTAGVVHVAGTCQAAN